MVRGRPRLKPFCLFVALFSRPRAAGRPFLGCSGPRRGSSSLRRPATFAETNPFQIFFYPEQIGANFALVGSGIQNVLTRIRNTLILQVPYCSLYLMGPTDEVEVVSVEELAHHVRPKGEADPTIILTPTLNILVRVRPQQVTQQS